MQTSIEKQKVFIVDDDAFQIALFSKQLARHEFADVTGFRSAIEALAKICQELENSLIVLDLNMPDVDGVEFMRKLVELKYAGALALVSGEDPRVLDSAARLAGAHQLNIVGCISKPCKNTDLDNIVKLWQSSHSRATQKPRKLYCAEEIRRALSLHETTNHYQPKVRLDDGKLIGVEALVRWQHPSDGLVYPDQFIGPAEAHGLIGELTEIVLVDSLEQYQCWKREGLSCGVAVNVSADSLVQLEFPDHVQSLLSRSGVPPDCLTLEITESRLTGGSTTHLDIAARLRLKDINLSIDDFGTGHSSLVQLRDMPFNEIKIDRSFVHGVSNNATLRAIVESNLSLAEQLGMTVVAEGIEDNADWQFMRERNCTYAQGYYIGKPMAGSALIGWACEWEQRRSELVAG